MKLLQHLVLQADTRHHPRFPPLQRTSTNLLSFKSELLFSNLVDERTKFDHPPKVSKQISPERSMASLLPELDSIPTGDLFDPVDFSYQKINHGKIQIGQWCDEINVFTTDDAPALITSNPHSEFPRREKEKHSLLRHFLLLSFDKYSCSRSLRREIHPDLL